MERAEAVAIYRQGEQACVEVVLSLAAAVEALQSQVAVLESRMSEVESAAQPELAELVAAAVVGRVGEAAAEAAFAAAPVGA